MTYKPNNVLVTGGMGFIGSHFVEYLIAKENISLIVNVDKLTYAASKDNVARLNTSTKHKFIRADICDADTISSVFKEYSIDTVVNFAAESHVDNSISSPHNFIATNIVGTFTLLEEAKKYWMKVGANESELRFHQVSTDEVYGSIDNNQESPNELAVYDPSSPYSASKASSDYLVLAYYKTYGVPVTLSHCSNNYGAYQHGEKFIPVVINSCVNKTPIPIYGDGSNIRDWIHVRDHCEALWCILKQGSVGSKYNVPGGFEISNLELAKLICGIMDQLRPADFSYESLLTFVDDRLGHDWRYSINGDKLYKECGWRSNIKFAVGIEETVKWYLMREHDKAKFVAKA